MIYIAAPYALHPRARALAEQLRRAGVEICSSWHDERMAEHSRPLSEMAALRHANQCAREVASSTLIVVLVPPEGGAGCFFEAGLAYARGVSIVWIGAPRLVFDALGERYATTAEWLKTL